MYNVGSTFEINQFYVKCKITPYNFQIDFFMENVEVNFYSKLVVHRNKI